MSEPKGDEVIPDSTILGDAVSDALLRVGKPVFVRRMAQELMTQSIISREEMEDGKVNGLVYTVEILADQLALHGGQRIALFARLMMPVSADQFDQATWPDGWWQAFRLRWFPRWWLRHHHVKWRTKNIRASINMSEIIKACLKAPADGKPEDFLSIVPGVEFDRWNG